MSSQRMMTDAALLRVLDEMEGGNFAIHRPDVPSAFDDNGVALALPPLPLVLFADVPARHLATELKAVLVELKQLREQMDAGHRAALLNVREEVDRLIGRLTP